MRITLGIESSCDETSVAIVDEDLNILSCITQTQIDIHKRFKGVVPEIASRHHVEAITATIADAMEQAKIKPNQLHGIAVTNRPGLVGSLLVGVLAAKSLAMAWDLPITTVNHIAAHLFSPLMFNKNLPLPLIGAAISGGHTELYLCEDGLHFTRIGRSIDDAAGEAFDKCAAILNLPYPGGPAISQAAKNGVANHKFPSPIYKKGNGFDFTFSGIKTSVLYHCKGFDNRGKGPLLEHISVADVAASFETTVCQAIIKQMLAAAKKHKAKSIIMGGGVACNQFLRNELQNACKINKLQYGYPPSIYCTDNAAMIAGLGSVQFANDATNEGLNFDVLSRI